MNKAVLEPRRRNNIGSLLEPACDIGDSHHVLCHHRANVIALGSSAARVRGAEAPEWRRVARSFCPVSNPPPYGCEVEAMTELMTVRLAELVNALRQKNAPTGDVCRGKLTHKETMSVKSS